MRALIWGLALGPRGHELAPIWLEALIHVGKWEQDIALLTDRPIPLPDYRNVRLVDVAKDIAERYHLSPQKICSYWVSHNLKSQILHHVDVGQYDYVLYLDMDVLANTDRLYALIENKWKKGVIAVQEDIIPLSKNRLAALELLGRPSLDEEAQWARRPICGGIMGFPINATGLAALRAYHEACVAMRFNYSDQAKLTAILNRQFNDAWEFLGDTAHGRRDSPAYQETLIHFTGQRDEMLRKYYQSWLAPEARMSAATTLGA
jgi:hypothetical protein